MHCQPVYLQEELEAFGGGIVCLTGGGGKTSLLYALGKAFASAGRRILCTATTRLLHPGAAAPLPLELCADPERLALPAGGALLAAKAAPAGGDGAKIYGYSAAEVDRLWARRAAEWIVVEADGAAGRPLKAPAGHEPVIPSRAVAVVAVVGLSCIGKAFGPEVVFRADLAAAIAGLVPGDAIGPAAVAALAAHPHGLFRHCPPAAARLLFCNQADLPGAAEAGDAVAEIMMSRHAGFLSGIYVGSLRQEGLRCRKLTMA